LEGKVAGKSSDSPRCTWSRRKGRRGKAGISFISLKDATERHCSPRKQFLEEERRMKEISEEQKK